MFFIRRYVEQFRQPIGRLALKVALQNVANETAEISATICTKFCHGMCTEHAIALKLRLRKKLIFRRFVREGFARLEILEREDIEHDVDGATF